MSSDWEYEGELNAQGTARTPGYGLDRSRSNSPKLDRAETESRTSRKSGSRSASGSPDSRHSARSNASNQSGSGRSNSAASNRSRGGSSNAGSNRSRSQSAESNRSRSSSRSKSGSRASNRSSSRGSNKSRSRSRSSQSGSQSGSQRSRSGSPSERSRSGSDRSRSNSQASNRSRSRSKSAESNRSSRSKVSKSRSRSRSRSAGSGSVRSNASAKNRRNSSRQSSPELQIDAGSDEESAEKNITETKKKKLFITSDSENDGEKDDKEEPSAAALFGDADDISSEEEKEQEERRRDSEDEDVRRGSDSENDVPRGEHEEQDKEPEPEPIPETRIDVEFPKISCDLGRDIHFVKLPNFLSVETRPFDQETYEDEIDEEETLDEEGRARLKLKVENTIRWREVLDKEGNMKKESNARFVRWSDGSISLHLGSEIFDVYKQPLQGDHNHLFIRQGTGLQGQAVFRTKLSFRPHSTESFTHRKMTLSLADRSQKVSGIKILSQVGADPDQDRKNLLKKEEEKLRQTARITKPRKREGTRGHQRENFREEDGSDEEGGISLNAIKNKYKSGAALSKGGAIYSSDEEGSDFEARKRKNDKAIALQDSDSSESE